MTLFLLLYLYWAKKYNIAPIVIDVSAILNTYPLNWSIPTSIKSTTPLYPEFGIKTRTLSIALPIAPPIIKDKDKLSSIRSESIWI